MSVASMIQQGQSPNVEAAIVKDLGTKFEQEAVRVVRNIVSSEELTTNGRAERLKALLAHAQLWAPAFTIRGGTTGEDRKSVVSGKGVSVRVDLGGRRINKKQQTSTLFVDTHS